MDVKSLYIIKRDTGVCLYHKDFADPIFDPHLISSFIVAMTSFFDEATSSVNSRARAFEGDNYKIIVEFGEWTLGALSVSRDSEGVRERLRYIVEDFEDKFGLLKWVDIDLAVYSRFEPVIIQEFILSRIDPDSQIRKRMHWEYLTKRQEVVSLLRIIPDICTVREAAEFLESPLEIVMNLVALALWDKAIILSSPVRPDDILQTTSITQRGEFIEGVSEETARAITQFDGETPLSIAAEKVKISDLKRFLEDIATLIQNRTVERVSPAQAAIVLYSSAVQDLLKKYSKIMGFRISRSLFFEARKELVEVYPWLKFIDLEDGVDVEVKSSLTSATVKGSISPAVLSEGFRAFLQFLINKASLYTGKDPINEILVRSRLELEKRFPNLTFEITWEQLVIG